MTVYMYSKSFSNCEFAAGVSARAHRIKGTALRAVSVLIMRQVPRLIF